MMKTILVATDFSPAAKNATHYGAEMAIALKGSLVLLHVFQLPVVYMEVPIVINESELRDQAQARLDTVKQEIEQRYGSQLPVNTIAQPGVFFNGLKNVCESVQPYSVVMGSQGSSAADRLFFGGHTVHAAQHLLWPVITVPPAAGFNAIRKIALACDFKEVMDATLLEEVKLLVHDFKAELHVLNIGPRDMFNPDIVFESGVIARMLDPIQPNYHFIAGEHTDDGIIHFVEEKQVDLLIALPGRPGLLDKLLRRSHTRNLVLHCHVPVMALHASPVAD